VSVKEALAAGKIYVAFQPIVDLRRQRIFAYEALARSNDPAYAGPLPLLKAAIEEDCLGELGREIRRMAVAGCPVANVFINIHPSEFDEGYLVRPDDPLFTADQQVYLEITESVPLSHFKYCHSVLAEIRSKGVRLVVDDLGAGYSNLRYIADLVPDIVKLDRSLVADLDRMPRLRHIVRAMVELCEDLGARVVAEGIERPGELAAVLHAGVHFGQGYLLARPAAPAPTVDWTKLDLPVGVS
jgi:EAL domain-containing protein (putative c-di-GMP-specific phosphodiesterase class I)